MTFMPILKIDDSEIPPRMLVVGDPNRLNKVADYLDDVVRLSENREYHTIRGTYKGQLIGAASHGVGSAGAGACFEELCRGGATRIIRAGSAGGLQNDVSAGDVVIAQSAVREDGLSLKLAPASYPATATPDIIMSMRAAATSTDRNVFEGIVLTSDLFYPHDVLGSDLPLWQRAGVTAVEMEAATLFVVCSLHGVERGAVLAIDGNPLAQDDGSMETYDPHQDAVIGAVDASIQIALASLIS